MMQGCFKFTTQNTNSRANIAPPIFLGDLSHLAPLSTCPKNQKFYRRSCSVFIFATVTTMHLHTQIGSARLFEDTMSSQTNVVSLHKVCKRSRMASLKSYWPLVTTVKLQSTQASPSHTSSLVGKVSFRTTRSSYSIRTGMANTRHTRTYHTK